MFYTSNPAVLNNKKPQYFHILFARLSLTLRVQINVNKHPMKLKTILTAVLLSAFITGAKAEKIVKVPFLCKTTQGIRPRMPSANHLPVCVYADGLLTISFQCPEGDAEVSITHSDYTEEYTASTETAILIYTDIAVCDTVEISTGEGNLYVAVRYE